MLPQASAPFPSKSNLTATAAQQPEPEPLHALKECFFLLPGNLIVAKVVSNLGLGYPPVVFSVPRLTPTVLQASASLRPGFGKG